MNSMQKAVEGFHKKHDLPVDIGTPKLDEDMLLRIRLISEESFELVQAIHQKNIAEVADAIGDLVFVLYGTAVVYGLDLEVDVEETSSKPMFPDQIIEMSHVLHLIQKVGDIADSLEGRNLRALQFDLEDTINLCGFISEDFGLPIQSIFFEVVRSNMTKPKLDAHNKGGKGDGFSPVDMVKILYPG